MNADRFALQPGEEDFSVILNDPDFVPLSRTGSHYGSNSAQLMARADAPTNNGGAGTGSGTASTGASDKQRSFLASLAAERNLEVEPRWLASKTSASAAIDKLLATPKPAAAPTGNPASDKQKTFVRSLLAERAGNEVAEAIRTQLNEARVAGSLTAAVISKAITALLEIPEAEIEAGVYVLPEGNLVRVYFGQNSGHMLAKVVIDGDLEYKGKADRVLVPGSRKATVEEVGNWGRSTGTCLFCARKLDDPESVDRGIGPVCYAKMGA